VFDVDIVNDDLEKAYEELKDILKDVSKTLNDPFSYLFTKDFVAIVA